ncbi:carotenoid biosynthesis protein [Acidianus brierleyi]|uniref:Carotenoid biosynthesis protein n=1 Tax=Acidianus brierleyi TaxID=41673 RepID=A0A2U9IH30_9CREN|nr:carotenoid biosynthesis protein [Acidianus brierleyi]AWR95234.1 carotenoid biosynthesis protein [Acidianus brierleyi]
MERYLWISFILLALGIIFDGILILFFIFSILALITISLKRKEVFRLFLSAMLIGFIFEKIGVSTGIPFGHYYYNFPPYILGVPIFVIFAWGIISFISYLPIMQFPKYLKIILFPLMMVIIDLSVDPIMVSAHYWTWEYSSLNWFGIPLTNFLGWYIVSMIIIIFNLFKMKENKIQTNPFPIIYFLFSLKFFIFAKLKLLEPLLIATIISLLMTILIFYISKRIQPI